MSDYKYVLLEKDPVEHIARLTINRPDRRNALNDAATDEMGMALEDVADDDDVRVLSLMATGGPAAILRAISIVVDSRSSESTNRFRKPSL